MKDLQVLFEECIKELEGIGIVPLPILSVTVNTRAKKRWGQTKKEAGGYSININGDLLAEDLPDLPAKTVLLHEILHCCPGGESHRGNWRLLAEKVRRELGYDIRVTHKPEDLGLPAVSGQDPKARYRLICEGCGQQVLRMRKSPFVTHPERYRCTRCGGKFKRASL